MEISLAKALGADQVRIRKTSGQIIFLWKPHEASVLSNIENSKSITADNWVIEEDLRLYLTLQGFQDMEKLWETLTQEDLPWVAAWPKSAYLDGGVPHRDLPLHTNDEQTVMRALAVSALSRGLH